MLSWRGALLATGFFALHPILIWASAEIRVYALVILLSVSLLRLFYEGFVSDDPEGQRKWRIWFVVLAVVSLYTNYYLGFLLVGGFAGLMLTGRWRAARDYLLYMAVTAVAVSPLVLVFKSQLTVNTTGFHDERTLGNGLRRVWDHMLTFILPSDIVPQEETTTASCIRLWVVRIGIAILGLFSVVRFRSIRRQTVTLGSISAAIIAFLLLAYFAVGSWLVALRHASVLFVPLILFLASLMDDLFASREKTSSMWGRIATPALGVVVLASFSYALLNLYPNTAKWGDWARVAAYIQANEHGGQPIVVFHTYDALVLPYHYRGVNRILPDERFFDFDFGTPTEERIRARTDFTISKVPTDAAELWLIENEECDRPGICDQFNQYVRDNFDIVDEHGFYMNRVQLLRRKPPYQK
jgi:hypothetical protein